MMNIRLLPAKRADLELLLAWRSHPQVYKFFKIQQSFLSWQEHFHWWRTKNDERALIVQLREDGVWRKIGVVSLKHLRSSTPEIGIYIGEVSLHGRGVGTNVLSAAIRWLNKRKYPHAVALIHKENLASQKIFLKSGFIKQSTNKDGLWSNYMLNIRELSTKM